MIVKLIGLCVEGLHGCYNYNVKFNPDVTFLYGLNGCGKTTILNITEAIITGQLFKLFNYKFKQIILYYAKSSNIEDIKSIKITSRRFGLSVEFCDKKYTLEVPNSSEELQFSDRNSKEIVLRYFNRYEFLAEIKNLFNYVYLPLNRSNASYDDSDEYYMMRRYRNRISLETEAHFGPSTRDIAMIQIESLIAANYSKISSTITHYNDEFRNSILKSLLEINSTYDVTDILKEISSQRNFISNLTQTKNAYLNMLKELELLTSSEEEKYNNFFAEFITEFALFQKDSLKAPWEFVMKFQEISKIRKLLEIAKKMEQRKAIARKPIETFLSTMNEFIQTGEDGKSIEIDSMGRVFFKTKYSNKPISIQYLSSGEKQLVTFFANLIFNVKSNSSGIFVVDEPELSLHLSWQKIFVEKTLEINKNIQLVFATHAPEIIGKRRDKMFKLEKEYTGVANNG